MSNIEEKKTLNSKKKHVKYIGILCSVADKRFCCHLPLAVLMPKFANIKQH